MLQGFKPNWARTRNVAVLTTVIGGWKREEGREGGHLGVEVLVAVPRVFTRICH